MRFVQLTLSGLSRAVRTVPLLVQSVLLVLFLISRHVPLLVMRVAHYPHRMAVAILVGIVTYTVIHSIQPQSEFVWWDLRVLLVGAAAGFALSFADWRWSRAWLSRPYQAFTFVVYYPLLLLLLRWPAFDQSVSSPGDLHIMRVLVTTGLMLGLLWICGYWRYRYDRQCCIRYWIEWRVLDAPMTMERPSPVKY